MNDDTKLIVLAGIATIIVIAGAITMKIANESPKERVGDNVFTNNSYVSDLRAAWHGESVTNTEPDRSIAVDWSKGEARITYSTNAWLIANQSAALSPPNGKVPVVRIRLAGGGVIVEALEQTVQIVLETEAHGLSFAIYADGSLADISTGKVPVQKLMVGTNRFEAWQ